MPISLTSHALARQRRLRARQQRRLLRVLRHGHQPLADRARAGSTSTRARRSGSAPSRTARSSPRSRSPRSSRPDCASGKLGSSSVRYEIGSIREGGRRAGRRGLVRARVRRPRRAPAGRDPGGLRASLERLVVETAREGPRRGAARDGPARALRRVAAAGDRGARARRPRARASCWCASARPGCATPTSR